MAVYTGADGSITLSTPEGVEGEKAQEVLDEYEMISVGRVQDVRVEVHSDVKPFHEIGQRYATELEVSQVGQVIEVGDGIARVYGLSDAMAGEMLEFDVMGQPGKAGGANHNSKSKFLSVCHAALRGTLRR